MTITFPHTFFNNSSRYAQLWTIPPSNTQLANKPVSVGRHPNVQRQSSFYQILHSLPISPHFPRSLVSKRLLHRHGNRRHILHLGHCQRLRELCPRRSILGPHNTRKLSQLLSPLVLQCSHEHRYRRDSSRPSNAAAIPFTASAHAKDRTDGRFCHRYLVSITMILRLESNQILRLSSVVITSILRLSGLRTVASSTDTSYANVDASYWTAAECNVAIICASLPFLRPIISQVFPKFLSTNSYNNRYTSNQQTGTNRFASRRSARQPSQLFSQTDDRDYDVYSINVKPGDRSSPSSLGGIEVTTEMTVMQESAKHGESVSERRLVMDSS